MAKKTTTEYTAEERTEMLRSKDFDTRLQALKEMTTRERVDYAAREFKAALPASNGRTWVLKKTSYLELERSQGLLEGRAAERAAALDTPETIEALQKEEAEIEALRTDKPTNHANLEDKMKKTAKKTTTEKTVGKAIAEAVTKHEAKKVTVIKDGALQQKRTRGAYVREATITVLSPSNPKRVGSASYERFMLYTKNKTVEKYLNAGGTTGDLHYDAKHEYIKIG